jgi:hypothetical protein
VERLGLDNFRDYAAASLRLNRWAVVINRTDRIEQGLERTCAIRIPPIGSSPGGPIIEHRVTAGDGHQPPVKRGILPQTRSLNGALPAT